jgi:hypothetical protein
MSLVVKLSTLVRLLLATLRAAFAFAHRHQPRAEVGAKVSADASFHRRSGVSA